MAVIFFSKKILILLIIIIILKLSMLIGSSTPILFINYLFESGKPAGNIEETKNRSEKFINITHILIPNENYILYIDHL